jgi:gluconolactonase
MSSRNATSQARPFYDDSVEGLRLDHPEGVAVAPDGSVWCGGEGGQVYRIEQDGSHAELVANTGGFVLGLTFDAAGNLYLCDQDLRSLLRIPVGTTRIETVGSGSPDQHLRIPNACACDGQGRIYVTDSYGSGQRGPGVFRFDPDGRAELWFDRPMSFANGIALSNPGNTVYVAESFLPGITAIPIVDDRAGEPSVVAELPGTVPDGLLVGPDDAIYVGCYEPSTVLRVTATGDVTVVATDPTAHVLCHPTNLARRGDQMLTANLGRWHLSIIEPAPWAEQHHAGEPA